MPIDELISGWQELIGGRAATQHLTGPVIEVDGLQTYQEEGSRDILNRAS